MILKTINEGMDARAFGSVQDIAMVSDNLVEALHLARSLFPGCFVYAGGHYIAIHSSSTQERVALITE